MDAVHPRRSRSAEAAKRWRHGGTGPLEAAGARGQSPGGLAGAALGRHRAAQLRQSGPAAEPWGKAPGCAGRATNPKPLAARAGCHPVDGVRPQACAPGASDGVAACHWEKRFARTGQPSADEVAARGRTRLSRPARPGGARRQRAPHPEGVSDCGARRVSLLGIRAPSWALRPEAHGWRRRWGGKRRAQGRAHVDGCSAKRAVAGCAQPARSRHQRGRRGRLGARRTSERAGNPRESWALARGSHTREPCGLRFSSRPGRQGAVKPHAGLHRDAAQGRAGRMGALGPAPPERSCFEPASPCFL